jgi:hypothetical protein
MTYSEKLKDPRWQKKRLEIFKRDKFTCQLCTDKENTLVVHHKKYINGKEPWDYKNEFLITLCEKCHEKLKDKIPYKGDIRYAYAIDRDKIIDRNGDVGIVIDSSICNILFDLFLCGIGSDDAFSLLLSNCAINYDLKNRDERIQICEDIKNFFFDLKKARYLTYDSPEIIKFVSKRIEECIVNIDRYFTSTKDKKCHS